MNDFISGLSEVPWEIWLVIALFVVLICTAIVLSSKKSSQKMTTKTLVLGGMCVALAFVLSYFRLMRLPQGGSVTLISMFPLILYSFVCGPVAGIMAGVAFGFLQFLQEAFAAHWISILLDYPLAFGCLGLAGFVPCFFPSGKVKISIQFIIATFLAIGGRFFMHLISGAVFFGMYAPEGMNPWIYSAGYNLSYLSIEFALTAIVGAILLATPIYKVFRNSVVS